MFSEEWYLKNNVDSPPKSTPAFLSDGISFLCLYWEQLVGGLIIDFTISRYPVLQISRNRLKITEWKPWDRGLGTIFWQGDEPKLHFHGTYAKLDNVKAGCMRENAETFLVLEAIIMEIKGVNAARELDPVSGMVLLKVKSAYPSKLWWSAHLLYQTTANYSQIDSFAGIPNAAA